MLAAWGSRAVHLTKAGGAHLQLALGGLHLLAAELTRQLAAHQQTLSDGRDVLRRRLTSLPSLKVLPLVLMQAAVLSMVSNSSTSCISFQVP